jgi:hypothetical protein
MTMDLVIKNQEFGFAVIAEESSVQVLIDPLVDPKYIAKEGLYAIIQEICKLVRYRVMSSK